MPAAKVTREERCSRSVKAAMCEKGLNQSQLGKKLGVSQSALSKMIKNIYSLPIDKALTLSAMLGVDICELAKANWRD